jgi:hypothetical protein
MRVIYEPRKDGAGVPFDAFTFRVADSTVSDSTLCAAVESGSRSRLSLSWGSPQRFACFTPLVSDHVSDRLIAAFARFRHRRCR